MNNKDFFDVAMTLPPAQTLPTNLLASVFNKTTATYKFYWFLSILESILGSRSYNFSVYSLLCRMICNAWYPVHYFKISFGVADRLSNNIREIQKITNIPIDAKKTYISKQLIENSDKKVIHLINHFNKCVPYRFLSPWFPKSSDKTVVELSGKYTNQCLYRIDNNTKQIQINPEWYSYLLKNNRVLKDFCLWNLTLYLQTKNPNVPDIANKLIKPVERESMLRQRKFWNLVIEQSGPIRCIYTGEILYTSNYALEHFIPWSFVSHNLNWNLVPVLPSVNSSKSNRLPNIDRFLGNFTEIQKNAVQAVWSINPKNKMLEDYLILGNTIESVANMPIPIFQEKYRKLMLPLVQIAENMGYEYWNI